MDATVLTQTSKKRILFIYQISSYKAQNVARDARSDGRSHDQQRVRGYARGDRGDEEGGFRGCHDGLEEAQRELRDDR